MDKKFEVAFVIPSLGSGGAERVVSNLSNEFTDLGIKVTVIMLANRNLNYFLNENVELIYLDCEMDNSLNFASRYKLRLKKIRNAIKNLKPNVVISFMSETNIDVCFAMTGLKIPLIVSERNDPSIDPSSKIKQYMRKLAYLKPRGFVFQTPDAQGYFSKRVQKRSKIIINPLSSSLPDPFCGEREKRIVSVGRLNKQKNFPLLIDAFGEFAKDNPEYSLEIYGEGMLDKSIKEYILSKGLEKKVTLMGFCRDVHKRIISAAMFVMTSDFEGMPNALLEAMAIGLPCISTDCPCGGPRMLIKDKENGILTRLGNKNDILQAMRYIAENPTESQKMSLNAKEIKKDAELTTITNSWIDYIKVCVGEQV